MVLGQVLYLAYALIVMKYAEPERYQNIIANLLHMVLESAPMIPPNDISQLEPYLFLKVATPIRPQVKIYQDVNRFNLGPSKELFQGHILRCYQIILIPRYNLRQLLEPPNNCLYLLRAVPLRTRCMYLMILST